MDPLRRLLDGPRPALPPRLDHLARRWAGWPPRRRLAARGLALVLFVAWAGGGGDDHGRPVTVVVAARDLAPGTLLASDDLVTAIWPADLAPEPIDAVLAVGQRLRLGLVAGAPLGAAHLAAGGIADLIPTGHAALAVPRDESPPLEPGDRVDVHADDVVSADDALVVAVDAEVVWVAVPRARARDLAVALARGPVSLTVLPTERSG